jgi:periplasmic protein CpxP/Spy
MEDFNLIMIYNERVRKGLSMNRKRAQFVFVLALVFLMGASFAAHDVFAGGEGRHGKFGGHDPLFRLLHKLNLTDAQKQQVAGILKSNEAEAKTVAAGMANARAQLVKAILSGDESAATAAAAEMATYTGQAAGFGAQIVGQVNKILTPDQQAVLQKMQAKIGSHTTDRVDRRFAHWDEWIAKHGQ